MNELFRNEINVVRDKVLIEGIATEVDNYIATLKVNFFNEAIETVLSTTFVAENNSYKSLISPSLIEGALHASITVEYEYEGIIVSYDKDYEIVNRLVEFDDFILFMGLDAVADEYIREDEYSKYAGLENVARQIVETYCYQKFNYWYGYRPLITSQYSIDLPQRIDKIDNIITESMFGEYIFDEYSETLQTWESQYTLSEGGYYLNYNGRVNNSDIFTEPNLESRSINILGWWGFKTPPGPVVTATKHIMKLHASEYIDYRNSYLYSRSESGEAISFNFSAFRDSTGSIIADDLLSPFRIINGFVI